MPFGSDLLRDVAALTGGRLAPGDLIVRLPARAGRAAAEVYVSNLGLGVDVKRGSSLYLLIGAPARVWTSATTPLPGERPPVAFDADVSTEAMIREWLDGGGREQLHCLGLQHGDGIHVYSNGITANLGRDRSPSEIADFVEALVRFAGVLPPSPSQRRPRLPPEFADLQGFARRWGDTDDDARTAEIDRARTSTLRGLVDAVKPRLAAIDTALDAAGEPLPDGLIALGAIAQAALEAENRLAERVGERR